MRPVAEWMWDIWESGQFVGDNRPMTRATIDKAQQIAIGDFRTLLFSRTPEEVEIPNLTHITINRQLGTDAASCDFTLLNQTPPDVDDNLDLTHAGTSPSYTEGPSRRALGDLAFPGYYTYSRGATPTSGERWGHPIDYDWLDMFIPNRLVRTYQGYGTDEAAQPHNDTKLRLTGIWLIDTVEYTSDGKINVHCRDQAKLLIEQKLFPPIWPIETYAEALCSEITETETVHHDATYYDTAVYEETVGESVAGSVGSRVTSCNRAIGQDANYESSVTPWYGCGANIYGHNASDAFDGNDSTYWLSVGNGSPNADYSYEFIQADTNGDQVNQVAFLPAGGGYTVYVGVYVDGVWQGTNTVPYNPNSTPAYPNGSNQKYVTTHNVPYYTLGNESWQIIDLPDGYNADRVRLTFTNLYDFNLGTWQNRAGVRNMDVRTFTPGATTPGYTVGGGLIEPEWDETIIHKFPGNMGTGAGDQDYTNIVKLFCAWAGFYWPQGAPADSFLASWGAPGGRVWGDFEMSGAWPVDPACIPPSFWDQKSVMDGIKQIQEILGFIFYIDSTGGVVFRSPNIWNTGNWLTGYGYAADTTRPLPTVSETVNLLSLGTTLDDTNLRSDIIVTDVDYALWQQFTPGYAEGERTPGAALSDVGLLGGQERTMFIPGYPFANEAELQKFGFLASLWMHWSYRKSRFRIPGIAALEPDDQIRLYERATSETYVHYVLGVQSTMDMVKGTWYCDIDTHWLGTGPRDQLGRWIINAEDVPDALKKKLGGYDPSAPNVDPTDPGSWVLPDPPPVDWRPNPDDDLFPDVPPSEDPPGGVPVPDPTDPDQVGTGGNLIRGTYKWAQAHWGWIDLDDCRNGRCNVSTASALLIYEYNPSGPTPQHDSQSYTIRRTANSKIVSLVRELGVIAAEQELEIRQSTGITSCRPTNSDIDGDGTLEYGTSCSLHSWGIAIDINPDQVGFRYNDSPSSAATTFANEVKTIKTTVGDLQVFVWGGDWSHPRKDPMHFYVRVTPTELAGGWYRT